MLMATSAVGLDRRHPKVLLMVLPTPSPYHELIKTKQDVRLRCLPLTFTGKKQADENNHNTQQPFYGPLSGTTWVSRYQKKHPPTHLPNHHPIFISFFHLPRSIASSLFKLHAWQSFCTTSLHVLFGLPLGLKPSTSYSIHFFTQSVSSFRSTCPYHRNRFCCSINIISPIISY